MFGLKKKGRESSNKLHLVIRKLLTPIGKRLKSGLRIESRTRIANRWARAHPKRVMLGYSFFAVTIFTATILSDFVFSQSKTTETSLRLDEIPAINHGISYLSISEANNEKLKHELSEMGRKGMVLYQEMDSLSELQTKTHEDSLRISNIYNILTQTFK